MDDRPWIGHERCHSSYPQTARLTQVMFVEHHATSHTTRHTKIFRCATCGNGVIQKYDRDTWNHYEDEQWDMYWYWQLEPRQLALLEEALQACPAPLDNACECVLHDSLRNRELPGGATEAANQPARMPYAVLWP